VLHARTRISDISAQRLANVSSVRNGSYVSTWTTYLVATLVLRVKIICIAMSAVFLAKELDVRCA
jgi:hypothetical protein